MMKVLQSVFVLVLWTFSWSAFAGVYDINIAGRCATANEAKTTI